MTRKRHIVAGYASHKNVPVHCPACDRIVERRSRQQIFCSTRCRSRAHKTPWKLESPIGYPAATNPHHLPNEVNARSLQEHGGYPAGGEGTTPPKLSNETNVLQWPKTGSSLFCTGPLNLLGGGSWKWPTAGRLDRKTVAKIR